MCPPVSPCKGAFVVHPPRTMRVFLVWKRRYADVRAGTQAPPLRFRLGGLCANGHFICVGLRGKILRSVVGAVPVCPSVSLHKGVSVVHSLAHDACVLLWKRRCADVRAGTQAPPLRFRLGRLRVAVDTVWVDYVWDGWFRLGGLRVNGYFICVECVEKYYGAW